MIRLLEKWVKGRELAKRPIVDTLFRSSGGKTDHPLGNEKDARRIIEGLPYANAGQTLKNVNHWLKTLDDTPVLTTERRYQLASQFDTATRKCQARLLEDYFALGADQLGAETRHRETLSQFWLLLGKVYFRCASETVHVSNLVALRWTPDAPWQFGIVRRMSAYPLNRCLIGIQLLPYAVAPVQMRTLASAAREGKWQWALQFKQPAADSSVHFLARRDLFGGGELVEATNSSITATVTLRPGGLVESGRDFDWLWYVAPPSLA